MRNSEDGVILVNVLAVVALASAVLVAMLSLQDLSIQRAQHFSEAAQAAEIARGGEASAITALRRDMADAPQTDHAGEPWAQIAEADRAIAGGSFDLAIADVQDRFNINMLASGGIVAREAMRKLLRAAGQPEGLADTMAAELRETGPVVRPDALIARGVPAEALAALSPWITVLPPPTRININAADEAMLALLFGNPTAARRLVAERNRKGFLGPEDIAGLGLVLPVGLGFTSDHYRVTVTVRIGGTTQYLSSLLRRQRGRGKPEVMVIERRRSAPN